VLGLAPSAGLRDSLRAPGDTLSKLIWCLDAGQAPDWVAGIGPTTLVVVDEAGMPAPASWPAPSSTSWAGADRRGWSAITSS
jgi:hypothetical protein